MEALSNPDIRSELNEYRIKDVDIFQNKLKILKGDFEKFDFLMSSKIHFKQIKIKKICMDYKNNYVSKNQMMICTIQRKPDLGVIIFSNLCYIDNNIFKIERKLDIGLNILSNLYYINNKIFNKQDISSRIFYCFHYLYNNRLESKKEIEHKQNLILRIFYCFHYIYNNRFESKKEIEHKQNLSFRIFYCFHYIYNNRSESKKEIEHKSNPSFRIFSNLYFVYKNLFQENNEIRHIQKSCSNLLSNFNNENNDKLIKKIIKIFCEIIAPNLETLIICPLLIGIYDIIYIKSKFKRNQNEIQLFHIIFCEYYFPCEFYALELINYSKFISQPSAISLLFYISDQKDIVIISIEYFLTNNIIFNFYSCKIYSVCFINSISLRFFVHKNLQIDRKNEEQNFSQSTQSILLLLNIKCKFCQIGKRQKNKKFGVFYNVVLRENLNFNEFVPNIYSFAQKPYLYPYKKCIFIRKTLYSKSISYSVVYFSNKDSKLAALNKFLNFEKKYLNIFLHIIISSNYKSNTKKSLCSVNQPIIKNNFIQVIPILSLFHEFFEESIFSSNTNNLLPEIKKNEKVKITPLMRRIPEAIRKYIILILNIENFIHQYKKYKLSNKKPKSFSRLFNPKNIIKTDILDNTKIDLPIKEFLEKTTNQKKFIILISYWYNKSDQSIFVKNIQYGSFSRFIIFTKNTIRSFKGVRFNKYVVYLKKYSPYTLNMNFKGQISTVFNRNTLALMKRDFVISRSLYPSYSSFYAGISIYRNLPNIKIMRAFDIFNKSNQIEIKSNIDKPFSVNSTGYQQNLCLRYTKKRRCNFERKLKAKCWIFNALLGQARQCFLFHLERQLQTIPKLIKMPQSLIVLINIYIKISNRRDKKISEMSVLKIIIKYINNYMLILLSKYKEVPETIYKIVMKYVYKKISILRSTRVPQKLLYVKKMNLSENITSFSTHKYMKIPKIIALKSMNERIISKFLFQIFESLIKNTKYINLRNMHSQRLFIYNQVVMNYYSKDYTERVIFKEYFNSYIDFMRYYNYISIYTKFLLKSNNRICLFKVYITREYQILNIKKRVNIGNLKNIGSISIPFIKNSRILQIKNFKNLKFHIPKINKKTSSLVFSNTTKNDTKISFLPSTLTKNHNKKLFFAFTNTKHQNNLTFFDVFNDRRNHDTSFFKIIIFQKRYTKIKGLISSRTRIKRVINNIKQRNSYLKLDTFSNLLLKSLKKSSIICATGITLNTDLPKQILDTLYEIYMNQVLYSILTNAFKNIRRIRIRTILIILLNHFLEEFCYFMFYFDSFYSNLQLFNYKNLHKYHDKEQTCENQKLRQNKPTNLISKKNQQNKTIECNIRHFTPTQKLQNTSWRRLSRKYLYQLLIYLTFDHQKEKKGIICQYYSNYYKMIFLQESLKNHLHMYIYKLIDLKDKNRRTLNVQNEIIKQLSIFNKFLKYFNLYENEFSRFSKNISEIHSLKPLNIFLRYSEQMLYLITHHSFFKVRYYMYSSLSSLLISLQNKIFKLMQNNACFYYNDLDHYYPSLKEYLVNIFIKGARKTVNKSSSYPYILLFLFNRNKRVIDSNLSNIYYITRYMDSWIPKIINYFTKMNDYVLIIKLSNFISINQKDTFFKSYMINRNNTLKIEGNLLNLYIYLIIPRIFLRIIYQPFFILEKTQCHSKNTIINILLNNSLLQSDYNSIQKYENLFSDLKHIYSTFLEYFITIISIFDSYFSNKNKSGFIDNLFYIKRVIKSGYTKIQLNRLFLIQRQINTLKDYICILFLIHTSQFLEKTRRFCNSYFLFYLIELKIKMYILDLTEIKRKHISLYKHMNIFDLFVAIKKYTREYKLMNIFDLFKVKKKYTREYKHMNVFDLFKVIKKYIKAHDCRYFCCSNIEMVNKHIIFLSSFSRSQIIKNHNNLGSNRDNLNTYSSLKRKSWFFEKLENKSEGICFDFLRVVLSKNKNKGFQVLKGVSKKDLSIILRKWTIGLRYKKIKVRNRPVFLYHNHKRTECKKKGSYNIGYQKYQSIIKKKLQIYVFSCILTKNTCKKQIRLICFEQNEHQKDTRRNLKYLEQQKDLYFIIRKLICDFCFSLKYFDMKFLLSRVLVENKNIHFDSFTFSFYAIKVAEKRFKKNIELLIKRLINGLYAKTKIKQYCVLGNEQYKDLLSYYTAISYFIFRYIFNYLLICFVVCKKIQKIIRDEKYLLLDSCNIPFINQNEKETLHNITKKTYLYSLKYEKLQYTFIKRCNVFENNFFSFKDGFNFNICVPLYVSKHLIETNSHKSEINIIVASKDTFLSKFTLKTIIISFKDLLKYFKGSLIIYRSEEKIISHSFWLLHLQSYLHCEGVSIFENKIEVLLKIQETKFISTQILFTTKIFIKSAINITFLKIFYRLIFPVDTSQSVTLVCIFNESILYLDLISQINTLSFEPFISFIVFTRFQCLNTSLIIFPCCFITNNYILFKIGKYKGNQTETNKIYENIAGCDKMRIKQSIIQFFIINIFNLGTNIKLKDRLEIKSKNLKKSRQKNDKNQGYISYQAFNINLNSRKIELFNVLNICNSNLYSQQIVSFSTININDIFQKNKSFQVFSNIQKFVNLQAIESFSTININDIFQKNQSLQVLFPILQSIYLTLNNKKQNFIEIYKIINKLSDSNHSSNSSQNDLRFIRTQNIDGTNQSELPERINDHSDIIHTDHQKKRKKRRLGFDFQPYNLFTANIYIDTYQDALLIVHAFRLRLFKRSKSRLRIDERDKIKNGNVFCFVESEALRRWTDGKIWSPSKILGQFLLYKEVPKGQSKSAIKKQKMAQKEKLNEIIKKGTIPDLEGLNGDLDSLKNLVSSITKIHDDNNIPLSDGQKENSESSNSNENIIRTQIMSTKDLVGMQEKNQRDYKETNKLSKNYSRINDDLSYLHPQKTRNGKFIVDRSGTSNERTPFDSKMSKNGEIIVNNHGTSSDRFPFDSKFAKSKSFGQKYSVSRINTSNQRPEVGINQMNSKNVRSFPDPDLKFAALHQQTTFPFSYQNEGMKKGYYILKPPNGYHMKHVEIKHIEPHFSVSHAGANSLLYPQKIIQRDFSQNTFDNTTNEIRGKKLDERCHNLQESFEFYKKTISITIEKSSYHLISYFQKFFYKRNLLQIEFFARLQQSLDKHKQLTSDKGILQELEILGVDIEGIKKNLPTGTFLEILDNVSDVDFGKLLEKFEIELPDNNNMFRFNWNEKIEDAAQGLFMLNNDL